MGWGAPLALPRAAAFHWVPGLPCVASALAQACSSLPSGAASGVPVLQVLGPSVMPPACGPALRRECSQVRAGGPSSQASSQWLPGNRAPFWEGGRCRHGAGGSPTELRCNDSHSEAQPFLAITSLHPWVSTTALGQGWGPRGPRSMAGAVRGEGTPELGLQEAEARAGALGQEPGTGVPGERGEAAGRSGGRSGGRLAGAWPAHPAGAALPRGPYVCGSRDQGQCNSGGALASPSRVCPALKKS